MVSGQNAKFECIVQSEPAPSVMWSKNGRIIEDTNDYQLHFRNGVCRLTISRAYPGNNDKSEKNSKRTEHKLIT